MMIIEITEDKFGRAMEDLACMEDKLESIKAIFEKEAMGYRMGHREHSEDMDYREMGYRKPRRERDYGRYE